MHRIVRVTTLALVTAALASFTSLAFAQDSLGVADSLPPPIPNSPVGGLPSLLGPAGTWHQLPTTVPDLTPRHGQSSIYDPVSGKIYEFGGASSFMIGYLGDLITFEPCSGTAWQPAVATGTAPTPRFGHSAIYDPVRKRMLLFGGSGASISGQLWSLSLTGGTPAWSLLTYVGGPGPRYGHTAIYDPVRDRMILFGGYNGSFLDEVWALNLSGVPSWTHLATSGVGPSNRDYASAIYDPVRDRMLVFGGNDGATDNDLYALSLGASPTWTQIVAPGAVPAPRLAHFAAYDPGSDAMIVVGGAFAPGVYFNDVHVLQLSGAGSPQWSQPTATGDPLPAAHSRGAAFVPTVGKIVCHGGTDDQSKSETDEIEVAGATFTSDAIQGVVTGRDGYTLVVDPVRRRMILHGGETATSGLLGDVLTMPLDGPGVWSEPCILGPHPSARHGHAAAYDPIRGGMYVFGGFDGAYRNDLSMLLLDSPMEWGPAPTSGTPPEARDYASLVYDSARDRLVMFGGNDANTYLNDVWELTSLSGTPTWAPLAPAGTPPSPRLAHRAIYDAARDRMLVLGGYDGAENGELWALEFSPTLQWVQLSPGGAPPDPRHSASLVYDSSRDRLLLFGGYDGSTSKDDLWELPLSGGFAWAPLTAPPQAPLARHGLGGVYDPVNDLMVVAGGFRSGVNVEINDTWVLNFGSFATPALVSLVNSSVEAGRVRLTWECAGVAGRAATVLRREGAGSWRNVGTATSSGDLRTWDDSDVQPGARYGYALDLGDGPQASVQVDIPTAPRFSFAGVYPTPATGAARLAFSLPVASPVKVEVFDVTGRRVGGEDLGVFPAGSHRVSFASLSRLPAGVYTLRLVSGPGSLEARATVVP